MRATKEGSRNILLVSSRANGIQVRDASDGLLLRSLSADLVGISIYDMLIEGSTIYCGSNRHEIFSVDFTVSLIKPLVDLGSSPKEHLHSLQTGALKKSRHCGAGAICVKLYKNYLIAACYDGNIYIFNIHNDDDAVNICGPSNMLLAMDLWDDKVRQGRIDLREFWFIKLFHLSDNRIDERQNFESHEHPNVKTNSELWRIRQPKKIFFA